MDKIELTEANLREFTARHRERDADGELAGAAELLIDGICSYARLDDGYHGSMFDDALSYLNAPGWGFTTDAERCLDEFSGSVRSFLAEHDPDSPDDFASVECPFRW